MTIHRYLAMTAAEIASCENLPEKLGYMACHFSPYGTGLSNCPTALPRGAMLILNDRIPFRGHDSGRILARLTELVERLTCGSVLLDFEQPPTQETTRLAGMIAQQLPCPVGVSESHAKNLSCPVFLPPVPHDTRLCDYLAPWEGREIWLEAALDSRYLRLTEDGCQVLPPFFSEPDTPVHHDAALHCRYQIRLDEAAHFIFHRRPEDLEGLLSEAEDLGVTRAIGLYQELRGIWV